MSDIRHIAHNTIWQTAGKIVSLSIALVAFGIMTRYLGTQGFGNYTTVFGFLTVFGILLDLGLQMTTTQLIANPRYDESRILSNALTLRLLTAIFFIGLVCTTVLFFPYSAMIKIGIVLAQFSFICNSLVVTLMSFFQKRLIMYQTVIAEVIAKTSFVIAIMVAVSFDAGLYGIIIATIIDNGIMLAGLLLFARRGARIRLATDWDIWAVIIKKTWPIALTIALNLIYFKGDILIMSVMRSQTEVGIYGAPYRILEVLINLIYLFLGLILPLFAAAASNGDHGKIKRVLQGSFDFLILIVVPMIIGGLFIGTPLMTLIAGSEFAVSGDIIKILLIATGSIFIAGLFGYAIVALDQQKRMIKFYAINAVISMAGYLFLIPRYGYWGAAWMTVVSELFILATAAYILYRSLRFLPKITIVIKAFLASGVMALVLYFLPSQNAIFIALAGAVTYGASIVLFKGIDRGLVQEIISVRKN